MTASDILKLEKRVVELERVADIQGHIVYNQQEQIDICQKEIKLLTRYLDILRKLNNATDSAMREMHEEYGERLNKLEDKDGN